MRGYTSFTPGGFTITYVPGDSYPPVQVPENAGKHPAESGETVLDRAGIRAVLLVLTVGLTSDALGYLAWWLTR